MSAPAQVDMFAGLEKAAPPGPVATAAFEVWNDCAKKFGWATATALAHGRPGKLRNTVKELGGIHQWRALLERCGTSDFLCGRSQSVGRAPFNFTLDWALKPANMLKLLEGNFLPKAPGGPPIAVQADPPKIAWRTVLEGYRPRGFWPGSYGPRPEDRGCRAPAEFLDPWKAKHGIGGAAAKAETVEDRLSSLIVSLRHSGYYNRANLREEELARLQGRPPVLVPAPDVAHLGMPPKNGAGPMPSRATAPRKPPTDALDLAPADWGDDIPEGDPASAEP